MQSVVDTFNSALEDGIYILDLAKREEATNNIVEFLDMHLNEIVNLTVECLVAIRMRLDRKNMFHELGLQVAVPSIEGESNPCPFYRFRAPLPSVAVVLRGHRRDRVSVEKYHLKPWSLPTASTNIHAGTNT
jgi:hypothetical protein